MRFLSAAFFLTCLSVTSALGRSLRVGTFNIRFDNKPVDPLDTEGQLFQARDQMVFGADVFPQDPLAAYGGAGGQYPVPTPTGSKKHEQPWHIRRSYLADQVLWQHLDLVGFQEVMHHQMNDLRILLGDSYDCVGVGRDDGMKRGEAVPIFWNKEQLQLLEVEHFWLSETPHVPGSVSWDASMTRMATLAHFLDKKTGQTVYALNTHFDHRGPQSRYESAKLILRKLQAIGHSRSLVLLLGDLNSVQQEEGYQTLTGGAYNSFYSAPYISSHLSPQLTFIDSAHELITRPETQREGFPPLLHGPFGEKFTNPGFPTDNMPPKNIDFVFLLDNGMVSPKKSGLSADPNKWHVVRYGIIPNTFKKTPLVSDHRLVVTELFLS